MNDSDRAKLREMSDALRKLTAQAKTIGQTAASMHLALLDSGLVEPKVSRSWEVEREDFLRSLASDA